MNDDERNDDDDLARRALGALTDPILLPGVRERLAAVSPEDLTPEEAAALLILSLMPGATQPVSPVIAETVIRDIDPGATVPVRSALRVAAAARVHAERGRPGDGLRLIERAEREFTQVPGDEQDRVAVLTVWYVGGLIHQLLGDYTAAVRLLERVTARNAPDHLRYTAMSFLALIFAEQGRIADALDLATRAWDCKSSNAWDDDAHAIPSLSAFVLAHAARLSPGDATWAVSRLDALLPRIAPQWTIGLLRVRAQYLCAVGEPRRASALITQVTHGFDLPAASPALRQGVALAEAQALLLQGAPGAAMTVACTLLEASTSAAIRADAHLIQLCGLAALGRPRHVLTLAAEWRRDAVDATPSGQELLVSVAEYTVGRIDSATRGMTRWLAGVEEHGAAAAGLLPPALLHRALVGTGVLNQCPPALRAAATTSNALDAVAAKFSSITRTQRRLLDLLREHTTLEGVAAAGHVSRNTVKSHTAALMATLGVSSRAEIVDVAESAGWYTLPARWRA